jgi:hypothetical protein
MFINKNIYKLVIYKYMEKYECYKINKNKYCEICNLIFVRDNYCNKCSYNLKLFINAYEYFFFTIKRLNNYQIPLIIIIFNNFNIFAKSLKLENYINESLYFNIIEKIKKLINIDSKKIKMYVSSNTKTFLYHNFTPSKV